MKIFALFDEDNSGGITFRNLKRVVTELGENLTDEELQVRYFEGGSVTVTMVPLCHDLAKHACCAKYCRARLHAGCRKLDSNSLLL